MPVCFARPRFMCIFAGLLASQLAGELLVPMTIVPGNLSEDDLLRLT